jgi:hypothetical protein
MLMTVPPKVTRKGKDYYTIAFAARLLGTNAEKARELMGGANWIGRSCGSRGDPGFPTTASVPTRSGRPNPSADPFIADVDDAGWRQLSVVFQ